MKKKSGFSKKAIEHLLAEPAEFDGVNDSWSIADGMREMRALRRDAETLRLIVKHRMTVGRGINEWAVWMGTKRFPIHAKSIHEAVRRASKGGKGKP